MTDAEPTQDGLEVSDVLSAATVFVNFAVSFLFQVVHGAKHRAILDFSLGVLLATLSGGFWVLSSFASILATFAILKAPSPFARRAAKKRGLGARPAIAIAANFALLLCVQVVKHVELCAHGGHSMFYNWTGSQMILFMKLCAVAVRAPVRGAPRLAELLGYCFTVNGSFTGSYVALEDWRAWAAEAHPRRRAAQRAEMLRRSAWNFAIALVFLGVFFFCNGWMDAVYRATALPGSARELAIIVLELYAAAFVMRAKYYFIWKMFHAAGCASGFAYAEPPAAPAGAPLVPRLADNVSVRVTEFGANNTAMTAAWNTNAARWFREFVYAPLVDRGVSKARAALVANVASAVWHGVAPGYFVFFVLHTVKVNSEKIYWRRVRPLLLATRDRSVQDSRPSRHLWRGILFAVRVYGTVIGQLTISLNTPCFYLLHGAQNWAYLKHVLFIPLWSVAFNSLAPRGVALLAATLNSHAAKQ
eukprot:gnl/Chilomastix_cuspidata/900.p1 GENE.gnl/Chilomastix_cuspidata/900~~gnl/Chilomastix_cuspidata/900.p1  ORF type:complete len:474 (+),score=174.39 gnl/Chilomastix_cuspidata/900:129-1550(+)